MTPRTIVLGGLCASAVALGLGRFAFTPILPLMQTAYGLDTEGAGLLAASNNVGYLLGALWAGWPQSEQSRHRLLMISLIVLPLSLAAMGLTANELAWNLIRLVAGMASALVFVLAAALVLPALVAGGWGRLSGIHFGGVGVGIMLSGSLVAWAGAAWGDGGAWGMAAVLCALLAANAGRVLTGLANLPAGSAPMPPPLAFPLSLLAASYFLAGLAYIVTGTFLVLVVRQTPGLGDYANLSWLVVGLAAFPSSAAWAVLAARIGFGWSLLIAHVLMAVGMALPAFSAHWVAVMGSAVLYGGTFLGIAGMSMAMGRAINPARAAGTMGWLTALFGVGQIIGPVLAAWMAQRWGWGAALMMAGAVSFLGAPLLGFGLIRQAFSCRSSVPVP